MKKERAKRCWMGAVVGKLDGGGGGASITRDYTVKPGL